MTAEDVPEWEVHEPGRGWKLQKSVVVISVGAPIVISGVMGERGPHVNGFYTATDLVFGKRPVYKKDGADAYIEYHADKEKWVVKRGQRRGKFTGWVRSSVPCASHTIGDVAGWDVFDKSCRQWRPQDGILVVHSYEVVITNVPGPFAESVNGKYSPTGETFGGRLVYKKEEGEVWIEYHAEHEKWMVKRASVRGEFRGSPLLYCVCVCRFPFKLLHFRSHSHLLVFAVCLSTLAAIPPGSCADPFFTQTPSVCKSYRRVT
jgi:hypothetical protein